MSLVNLILSWGSCMTFTGKAVVPPAGSSGPSAGHIWHGALHLTMQQRLANHVPATAGATAVHNVHCPSAATAQLSWWTEERKDVAV